MAIVRPSGEILFEGLTINEFSAGYNLQLAKSQGIEAAMLRATAGSNYTDLRFPVTVKRVQEAGMKLGFYHYLIAGDANEAREQARFFASAIAEYDYDLRPAMLFEMFGDLNRSQANNVAMAFLSEVERITGIAPAVYTDVEMANNLFSSAIANRFPLWIMDEQEAPNPNLDSPWRSWVGWQYRRVSGADCLVVRVPVSKFSSGMLAREYSGSDRKLICLTVAPGDTLSGIARLFGSTVDEIVQLNRIANPNLIFPGQQIYIWVDAAVPYPCCDSYTVRQGDTLSAIGNRFGVDWRRLASINEISNPDFIVPGQVIKLGLC